MKLALVLLVSLTAAVAHADLPVQARGSATITGGDAAAAKARALDDALRQAVDQAVSVLLTPEQRAPLADLVKKRILRRAKSYVSTYKLASEGESEGVYAVTIDAVVADGPLGADLRALSAPKPEPDGPAPVAKGRPSLVVLAVTKQGDLAWATFGRGAEVGPVAPALARELEARGFKIAPSAGLDVPVVGEIGEGLPIDVAQSAAVAKQAGAGGALVAAALVRDGGRIRGTRRSGAEVDLHVRLDDAVEGGKVVEAALQAAGSGENPEAAALDAGRAAATAAGRALGKRLESHWPPPDGPVAAGVLVHLRGVLRGPDVDALARALAGGPGVKGVVMTRLARREVTLLAKGARDARALAGVAAGTALPGSRVGAKAQNGEVLIDVTVDPLRPAAPIPAPQ